MSSKNLEEFFSSMDLFNSNLFDPSNLKSFKETVEEQRRIEKKFRKHQKKPSKKVEKNESWSESDEELKEVLEKAMSQHSKTKKVAETNSTVKTDTFKHENWETSMSKNLNGYENSNPNSNEKLSEVFEGSTNADAAEDIKNLINHFFLPKPKSHNLRPKSYEEYEKQGAVPKYMTFSSSERAEGKKKNRKSSKTKQVDLLNVNADKESDLNIKNLSITKTAQTPNFDSDEIEKASEEICRKPFYYIVPENPSPKFFLPCGSYLVTSKNPSSQYDTIIFHPERGEEKNFRNQTSGKEGHESLNSPNSRSTNDLGKVAVQKMDSHLNIGPSDIKVTDIVENLEKSYSIKTYNKGLENGEVENDSVREGQNSAGVDAHETQDVEDAAVVSEQANDKKLNAVLQKLMSTLPDASEEYCLSIAYEFLNDEPGLENFISAELLTRKLQQQLQLLIKNFPDHNVTELSEKCVEFKGDDQLVLNYVTEQRHLQKMMQLAIELQHVFPDADPDFLMENVQKANGDAEAMSIFTEGLLETMNYPKISDDESSRERRKLWKLYVLNFDPKSYLLKVPHPENFEGSHTGRNKNEELVLKFLKSRYPTHSSSHLEDVFNEHDRNLTKTCINLSIDLEPVKLIESSFQNEAFDEDFLKEICYIENKKKIEDYLREQRELKMVEKEDALLNGSFLICPLCIDEEVIPSEAVTCPEGHVFCAECIKMFVNTKLADGVYKYMCPIDNCETYFTLATLMDLLPENVISNIIKKQQAEEISTAKVDGLELCRYCDFAYIPDPEDKIFKCQNSDCLMETCRKCGEVNHIPLRCEEVENSDDLKARKIIEEAMTEKLVRTCPSCQKKFVRSDGCNKMVCTCGTVVCYVCRLKVNGYEHFQGNGGTCPLYTANEELHGRTVLEAGIATRDSILEKNPYIKFLHDPTKDF